MQLQIANHELTTEQMAELERRIEEHRKNPDDTIPWEEVRESMLRRTEAFPKS